MENAYGIAESKSLIVKSGIKKGVCSTVVLPLEDLMFSIVEKMVKVTKEIALEDRKMGPV